MTLSREAGESQNRAEPEVVFTGCSITDDAPARTPAGGRRRQVVVNGRRVKTIDVHAHCVIQEAADLCHARPRVNTKPVVAQDRIRDMDEQGIDIEALSINPDWYELEDRDLVSRVITINNEKLAELCGSYPDRFVAFSTVALQFPDLAIKQLEHALKKLGLRGVAVGASVAGVEFSDPKFHPFWAKCEELGALIFIHPTRKRASDTDLAKRFKGSGWLENVIGNPLDTTIALSHLIFEGTLDRFPGLKICAAHGGGYLPAYAARSDQVIKVRPDTYTVKIKKKPTDYLKDLYYDSMLFTSEGLRHLVAEVGSSQICLGTDHPVGWEKNPVDHVMNTPGLNDDEREAILGRTAAKLLGIN